MTLARTPVSTGRNPGAHRGGFSGIAADSQFGALLGMIATQLGSATVAQLGQTLANDEARTIINLVPVLRAAGLQLPQFSEQDAQNLQNMASQTGTAFDQQFAQFVVQQEQKEAAGLEQQINSGADSSVRALASQLLPRIQTELAAA